MEHPYMREIRHTKCINPNHSCNIKKYIQAYNNNITYNQYNMKQHKNNNEINKQIKQHTRHKSLQETTQLKKTTHCTLKERYRDKYPSLKFQI